MDSTHQVSFGILPLRKKNKEWELLIVQHEAGHWSFPKGHSENNETPFETAIRELKEETHLSVIRFISETPFKETYFFRHNGKLINKTVTYYLAEVEGSVILQKEELIDYKWVLLFEASDSVTFPPAKAICERILDQIPT